jgi:hypothetical protein
MVQTRRQSSIQAAKLLFNESNNRKKRSTHRNKILRKTLSDQFIEIENHAIRESKKMVNKPPIETVPTIKIFQPSGYGDINLDLDLNKSITEYINEFRTLYFDIYYTDNTFKPFNNVTLGSGVENTYYSNTKYHNLANAIKNCIVKFCQLIKVDRDKYTYLLCRYLYKYSSAIKYISNFNIYIKNILDYILDQCFKWVREDGILVAYYVCCKYYKHESKTIITNPYLYSKSSKLVTNNINLHKVDSVFCNIANKIDIRQENITDLSHHFKQNLDEFDDYDLVITNVKQLPLKSKINILPKLHIRQNSNTVLVI